MPSYNNFRNDFRRRNEGKNVFLQTKEIIKEKEISEERRKQLIDWITFYRRNIQLFVSHYFGIKLYPYQKLWLYEMGVKDSYVAICSRAVGKNFKYYFG